MSMELKDAVVADAHKYLDERLEMIRQCLFRLDRDALWARPNPSSNSVGNLVLHLCGNITQYILSALGGKEDLRERELEFTEQPGLDAQALYRRLSEVIDAAKEVIGNRSEAALLQEYQVQGFRMRGTTIVAHVVEHLSYHTGQIAYYTKMNQDQDLGFYRGHDLNSKNEN